MEPSGPPRCRLCAKPISPYIIPLHVDANERTHRELLGGGQLQEVFHYLSECDYSTGLGSVLPEFQDAQPTNISITPGLTLISQPDTDLVQKVGNIYKDLGRVEDNCIKLCASLWPKLRNNHELSMKEYQELIELHQRLLHKHLEFFLTSHHPSVSATARGQLAKYVTLKRIWRHGIKSPQELLRKRLEDSREYMLTFVETAYCIMRLLYEIVPTFADGLCESLGDLARYRMAIENYDSRDHQTWKYASRYWYWKVSNRLPTVGRLYHHLGMVARPDVLQQLYYYSKSWCVPTPFSGTGDSIGILFKPILNKPIYENSDDEAFVKFHAVLLLGREKEEREVAEQYFLDNLDGRITEREKDWLHPGYYIAICLICSLVEYGSATGPLADASETFQSAKAFAMKTCQVVFRRKADTHTLPFLYTIFVFLHYVAEHPTALSRIENDVPWQDLVTVLNAVYCALNSESSMTDDTSNKCPLPENYAMRGFLFAQDHFLDDWFHKPEEIEETPESRPAEKERCQRILCLGWQICNLVPQIEWNQELKIFRTVNDEVRSGEANVAEP
ncbi:hypothetical protein PWT90_09849 [Aphanocladium album]|nr:hypothetical protein PWT90_09849 [Aphanocladium album]